MPLSLWHTICPGGCETAITKELLDKELQHKDKGICVKCTKAKRLALGKSILAALCVVFALWVTPAHAGVLFTEDFATITVGNIVGLAGSPSSQSAIDLAARNWFTIAGCPTYYCPAAIVSMTGPQGTTVKALRLRYEEGQSFDQSDTGLEAVIGKEDGFGSNPLTAGYQELWERYYFQIQPVPPNTPACTPNCPTASNYHDVASKQHYYKALIGNQMSFVTDHFLTDRRMQWAIQGANDCNDLPSCLQPPPVVSIGFNDNRWYCIETRIKINDPGQPNGAMEIYVDGVRTINVQNRTFVNSGTHRINQMIIYRQSSGYQWRLETDFAVSTTRIGCSGFTPPPADTTAPNVPFGLQIH